MCKKLDKKQKETTQYLESNSSFQPINILLLLLQVSGSGLPATPITFPFVAFRLTYGLFYEVCNVIFSLSSFQFNFFFAHLNMNLTINIPFIAFRFGFSRLFLAFFFLIRLCNCFQRQ